MITPSQFVQKLWNYCSILQADGLSNGGYVEQLTFLLFLKMAESISQPVTSLRIIKFPRRAHYFTEHGVLNDWGRQLVREAEDERDLRSMP